MSRPWCAQLLLCRMGSATTKPHGKSVQTLGDHGQGRASTAGGIEGKGTVTQRPGSTRWPWLGAARCPASAECIFSAAALCLLIAVWHFTVFRLQGQSLFVTGLGGLEGRQAFGRASVAGEEEEEDSHSAGAFCPSPQSPGKRIHKEAQPPAEELSFGKTPESCQKVLLEGRPPALQPYPPKAFT